MGDLQGLLSAGVGGSRKKSDFYPNGIQIWGCTMMYPMPYCCRPLGGRKGVRTMARLRRPYLPLDWEGIEDSPDLERVAMVLESLPDEGLMKALEASRPGRRDVTSVRVKWNMLLAGRVVGHATMNGLLRELKRNPALRRLVGINPAVGPKGAPDAHEMSRFWRKLGRRFGGEVDSLRAAAVERLRGHLPDLGEQLGTDTTALRTWARGRRDPKKSADPEADWGRKIRRWKGTDGQLREDVTKWFGYKAHLLVDTRHELPLARRVTKASRPDAEKLLEMVRGLKARHPGLSPKSLSADKAHDDGGLTADLWRQERVRGVFDLRDTAQDGEDGERLPGGRNILLGDDGRVYCYAKAGHRMIRQAMRPWGFEADRGTTKYRCPAAALGTACPERERCGSGPYGRVVRVKHDMDWRRFGPMARHTKQWKRLCRGRTACERVNARLKGGMAMDDLHVRGIRNVTMSLDVAILTLYALALGHLRRGAKHWRSYTRIAH